jgi:hypothetical protein
MKILVKSVLITAALFAAKSGIAQVNVGATTATKIVTQTALPSVNAATVAQKAATATTNISNQAAAQAQSAAVRTAAQTQAATNAAATQSQAAASQAANVSGTANAAAATNAGVAVDKANTAANLAGSGSVSGSASADKAQQPQVALLQHQKTPQAMHQQMLALRQTMLPPKQPQLKLLRLVPHLQQAKKQ